MLARDRSAAQREHADLLRLPLAAEALAAVENRRRALGVQLLQQELCRAARRVGLLVVVDFHDLLVPASKNARIVMQHPAEHGDARAVVRRPDDRQLAAQLLQGVEVRLRQAGRAADKGGLRAVQVAEQGLQRADAGKIEADVRAGGRFIGLRAGDVGMADDLPPALQRQLLEHTAHFAVAAQKYLHSAASCTGSPASRIMRFRLPRFSGAMGYIGIRKCPACRPIRFMAVFTGMGLTSMNRALMRSR